MSLGSSLTPTIPAENAPSAYESLKASYLAAQARYERLEDLVRAGSRDAIRVGQEKGELPDPGRVSIVIPVWNQGDLTKACIASIRTHTGLDHEIVLIDNGSDAATKEILLEMQRESTRIRVIENEQNEGFAFACNQGIAAAKGEHIVFLNNDVAVTERWLTRMLAFSSLDRRLGLVGPRSNRASGPQQVDELKYDDLQAMERVAARYCTRHQGDYSLQTRLVGLCLLVTRDVIETIGGFDPCFFPGNLEDDDFCLRAVRAGFQPAIVDDVFVHHAQSATFKGEKIDYARTLFDNWRWFCDKHEHSGEYGPYPARHLATKRAFEHDLDFVPPRHDDVFKKGLEPLALEGARGRRILMFVDAERGAWQERLKAFLASHAPDSDVSLVLRIEPPQRDLVDAVVARVTEILKATGKPDSQTPDVMADITPIPSSRRGSLYAAAHELWLTGSPRDRVYRREAEACGVRIGSPNAGE